MPWVLMLKDKFDWWLNTLGHPWYESSQLPYAFIDCSWHLLQHIEHCSRARSLNVIHWIGVQGWLIHLRFTFVLRSMTLRSLKTLSKSPFLSTYKVKVIEKMEELLHLSFDEKWWSACNHLSSIRISHIQTVLHFDARIEEVEKIDGNIICLVRGACPSWFDLIFRLHWCPKHVKDGGIFQQPEKSSTWTYNSLWMLYVLYHL